MNKNSFLTLTFGDCAENHVGMQKIGEIASDGFNFEDLTIFKERMEDLGSHCDLIKLNLEGINAEDAYVLIVRDGVNKILNACSEWDKNDMFEEQLNLNVDKKALMYGRIVNKNARYNLCFNNESPRRGSTFVTKKITEGLVKIKNNAQKVLKLTTTQLRQIIAEEASKYKKVLELENEYFKD